MNIVHLMVGIQGSGKSTLATKLATSLPAVLVSTDEIRKTYPKLPENMVLPKAYEICYEALKNGHDVIYDATNITPKVRMRFINALKSFDSDINFMVGCHYMDVPVEICKKRVDLRNKQLDQLYLPIEVVDSYFSRLIKPTIEEGYSFIKIYDDNLGLIVEMN